MIRQFKKSDTDAVMRLWLEGNTQAHYFIDGGYWAENYDLAREAISAAEVYVYEKDGEVVGFAGTDNGFIEGIFVDKRCRSAGIGHKLIGFLKEKYPHLSLSVYKRNARALNFYLREGFTVTQSGRDETTGEEELTLSFSADDAWVRLYNAAKAVLGTREISGMIEVGGVAAALMSDSGNIYTGVCIDTACSLGMCAERNAAAHMITCGESKIAKVAAIDEKGGCVYPCGACLEMMMQLCGNGGAEVLISYPEIRTVKVKDLLPFWWKIN